MPTPSSESGVFLAVDIGGTKIAGGIVNAEAGLLRLEYRAGRSRARNFGGSTQAAAVQTPYNKWIGRVIPSGRVKDSCI